MKRGRKPRGNDGKGWLRYRFHLISLHRSGALEGALLLCLLWAELQWGGEQFGTAIVNFIIGGRTHFVQLRASNVSRNIHTVSYRTVLFNLTGWVICPGGTFFYVGRGPIPWEHLHLWLPVRDMELGWRLRGLRYSRNDFMQGRCNGRFQVSFSESLSETTRHAFVSDVRLSRQHWSV